MSYMDIPARQPIRLHGGGPAFGLPEVSPYTMKTEVQLQIAGLPYIHVRAQPADSPKGQLPFITDDDVTVADSTFIRSYIEQKYGVDLDAALSTEQRAVAWAVERMVENQLGWACAYFRYADDASFANGPARWYDAVPEPQRTELRQALRDKVMANLFAVGITRHGHDEIVLLGARSLRSLSVLLGDKPYLFGGHPTGSDAIAFAQLANILSPYFDNALRRRAEAFHNLVDYVERMMERFYPRFAWRACQKAA
ncbi:glutathione S-transferase family protein [Ferrovibrio sp.]|uniref:glutathione S-transferase family protein n=1 Tax=Ferrovibrio sp. TaxID=1917215 RepID=UPI002631DC75|nr:glutathione S-transferase family protein [Ferrovibrio sp.]